MSPRILHISDLHRDPTAPLANGPLLESLLADVERVGQLVPAEPDIIVVSGDIVQGVPPGSDSKLLEAQYEQAEQFLSALTDELVGGHRSHVIMVPGNHDVSFPTFLSSLREVEYDEVKWGALVPRLFERDSGYRWSWSERALYEIHDPDAYLRRLEMFSMFYSRFYRGERAFPLDPSEQYEVFDYEDLMLTVVGYSSCCNNDPWHRSGNIHSDAIAASLAELRAPRYSGRALIGVWHHSISGLPHKPDFMDEERVQVLLAHGFTLGLHGHHHRAERVHTASRFGAEGQITVISAGTLCGGPGSLPTGRPRSFNVIDLDVDGGTGRLHVRSMINDGLDHPIWGHYALGGNETHTDFTISGLEIAPASRRQELVAVLTKAQDLMNSSDYRGAVDLLLPHVDHGLARRVLLEALTNLNDPETIARTFSPPISDVERIHVMEALWELGDRMNLTELLQSPGVSDSVDASVRKVRDTMAGKLRL